jgi:Tfp pilus assembly protein FimV
VVAGASAASAQANSSAALDAEAAALQQRVAELTGMVDRMQQEMRATEALQAAQGARIAAEKAARTSPQAIIGRWWNENWPLLVGVVGLAALIAAVLPNPRQLSAGAPTSDIQRRQRTILRSMENGPPAPY